ncbi:MAG: hypothetical protein R2911_08420 [Caldilineaceae bacterium]
MKAMLYMSGAKDPVGVFDEVNIVTMNDNHKAAPQRITYKTQRLNVTKKMLELFRDEKMSLKLEDGRTCAVLLQHNSMDMQGNAVGVLRVLGDLS